MLDNLGKMDLYKVHRSTSIRLRKRRDQAKKDFLLGSPSGQFVSDTRHDGWSYMSFQEPSAPVHSRTSGPVSLSASQARGEVCADNSNPMPYSPRSLGYIPTVSAADLSSRYYQHGPSLHGSLQVMSDTEDCLRTRGRGGRASEETRERKPWRRSAIGLGDEERAGRIVYKDFGMIDNPPRLEALSERNIPLRNKNRSSELFPRI